MGSKVIPVWKICIILAIDTLYALTRIYLAPFVHNWICIPFNPQPSSKGSEEWHWYNNNIIIMNSNSVILSLWMDFTTSP